MVDGDDDNSGDHRPKTVFDLIMSRQRPPPSYDHRIALHRPVPLSDNATDKLTRQYLPFFLPWSPNASPKELPADFSWLSSSCGGKAVIGTLGGGAMGLVMGLFLGAMSDATPNHTLLPTGHEVPQAPLREQLRVTMRATLDKSRYWCRNFAFLTGIFGGTECLVEKYRGKHDLWNSVASGCVTGAALQAKAGPQAAAVGCGGFAAFSLVIDSVMQTH